MNSWVSRLTRYHLSPDLKLECHAERSRSAAIGTPAESKHPYRLSDSCDRSEFLGLCVHSKYEVTRLLYGESYDDVHRALAREKQLGGWSRAKKVVLICGGICVGWAWLRNGTHGCVMLVGMLRLRNEDRSAPLSAPLSITGENYGTVVASA